MTTETPGEMTADEHMAEAWRFAAQAEERGNAWDRSVDLQAAQVHATLAHALNAKEMLPMLARAMEWAEETTPSKSAGKKP